MQQNHRNLVIVRAGDESLHEHWLAGPKERTWDIIVSYFGNDPERYRRPDLVRIDAKGPKWPALYDLVQERKEEILRYNFVWFPDDDLDSDTQTINKMFATCAELELHLAQPSLSRDSYISHPITLVNKSFQVRYTNFVEIMAPLFSRAFLSRCAPTFGENLSGYGLDLLWPTWCSEPRKIAIIDACTVRHTRPMGGPNYKAVHAMGGRTGNEELRDVINKYGLAGYEQKIEGGIDIFGRKLFEDRHKNELIEAIVAGYMPELSNQAAALIGLLRPTLRSMHDPSGGRKLAELDPTIEQLATRLLKQKQPNEAVKLLEAAMKAGETAELWNGWATATFACGDPVRAEQGFKCALELDGLQTKAAVNLAMLLMMQGRYEESIPILKPVSDTLTEQERTAISKLIAKAKSGVSVSHQRCGPAGDATGINGGVELSPLLGTEIVSSLGNRPEQSAVVTSKVDAALLQLLKNLDARFQGTVSHHVHQISQTLNLIARRQTRANQSIRCVFLVHHIAVWDALVNVYQAMADAPDFDPIVITLPHCFNKERTFTGETAVHDALQTAGIPHLRFNMANSFEGLDTLKVLEPDIIFRQSPWDADVPPAFATSEINFARLCYVSYGYQTIQKDSVGSHYDADQTYHRACWRIFCMSEKNLALIANNSLLRGRNAVLTGYPKFDRLVEAKSRPFWPIDRGKRHFRVIWGAHHSVKQDEWDGFGMFPLIFREMLEWARRNQDVEIAFKPHPMLFESCAQGLLTREAMNRFKTDWQTLPNTAFVEGGDYGPLFAASDAMISDGISFFSEYQLFDKPLVYLDSQKHSKFNPAGAVLLQGMYRAVTLKDALSYLAQFKQDGKDPLKEARQSVIREIMPYPGESANRILAAIRVGLNEEKQLCRKAL